ncbi:STAS domain-containing protein [Kibdelosporangium phytohabitans]|uniref:STAS domain-containing protein n=1 Tax=Kibdelosporangium phytohabitans TaxID=860235 RepID=UPI000AE9EDB6|nr:rsbT co-antagonist protein RsbR [Kibdelosporangium phytohabitans]
MAGDVDNADQLGSFLAERADLLIRRWVSLAAEPLRGRMSEAELDSELREVFPVLVTAVTSGSRDTRAEAYGPLRAMLEQMSRSRARLGFTPTETAAAVFALKQAVFEQIDQGDNSGASVADVVAFSVLLDALGLWTFECYARAREEVITQQAEQLLELTTPVVKLWSGVLAVPLVGTLDSARTQVVMEKLLEALVDTGAEQAIVDITGVLAVDTQVAQHLLKTVMAARLMGAECTISGIRPQIAQTIVDLGIEFGDITTKASLADALLHALRKSGVDVVTRSNNRMG